MRIAREKWLERMVTVAQACECESTAQKYRAELERLRGHSKD